MTLFTLFELVNYISGKYPSGATIPPARFNLLLPQVQSEYFDTCLNELIAAQQNEDIFNKLMSTTPLLPFKKSASQVPGPLPSDYVRYISLQRETPTVQLIKIVNDETYTAMQGSVLTRARVKPFAKISGTLQVVPYDIGQVRLDYFRRATTPYMDYVQPSDDPNRIIYLNTGNSVEWGGGGLFDVYKDQYSNANGDDPLYDQVLYSQPDGANYRARTTELEWRESDQWRMLYLLLRKIGVPINEQDVIKLATEKGG